MKDWFYYTCRFLQRGTLKAFADWEVVGRENIPPMGPLIIIANHQSNMDPPMLVASLQRRVYFLAKSTVFNSALTRWLLASYGAFPLDRDKDMDIRAYRWVINQLNKGQPVVLFPEGTRSPNGMIKAKSGFAQIALHTQAPILPVGITGTESMGSWGRVFFPTGRLKINVGRVFSLPDVQGKPNKEIIDSFADMIMERVAQLLPESYRGVYGHQREAT
ncbi:MAG: 1-acyl-sn-glycerol-3-phosphate acyltransferase [Chloroflexi bacterium]|nr:1-acyl-sn-glycerol-3-phosphate acyltransferase [Chloroflexota bacterium]MCI0840548.1 1-acyl-sn-glycerol-3-phosphate acyltransferase [Chloroflexota bacterium]MCI0886902.1 1-acyl-sn-glycerol-3-phosphate acyltransferase [Chloroflexota bacterium]